MNISIKSYLIILSTVVFFGCAKEKMGQQYILSGYITPVIGEPDSVLKNQLVHVQTAVGTFNRPGETLGDEGESYFVRTDPTTGYFEVVYSDPTYIEGLEQTRLVVKEVYIQLVGNHSNGGVYYASFSPICHFIHANFYPTGGNDNIMQYCVPVR